MKRRTAHPRPTPKPLPLTPRDRVAARTPAGWHTYLVLAAALAPLCLPAGPGNSALLDVMNLVALAGFGLYLLRPGRRLHTPLLVPVAIIAVGSLLASLGAPSPQKAALSVAQDLYLFVWFLALVNLIRSEREVRLACAVWTWAAVAVSLVALGQLYIAYGTLSTLLGSRGFRPASTLYNPNMLADYLVVSLFLAMSLFGTLRKRFLVPALGTIFVGLLATKSNGGMLSLGIGAFVWVVVSAVVARVRLAMIVAGLLLAAGVAGLGLWIHGEWGVGEGSLSALRQHTFAGRLEKSTRARGRILDQLERAYARSPLGIGPGNSGALTLSITERERPESYQSKEAHSDYLAYAVERGPLGLAGLVAFTGVLYAHVAATWRDRPRGAARARQAGRWVAAATAALTASAAHSLVIEKLHFRHFWLLLALVSGAAIVAAGHAARRQARLAAASPAPAPESVARPAERPARRRLRPAAYLQKVMA
jgi:O-antigen ligase